MAAPSGFCSENFTFQHRSFPPFPNFLDHLNPQPTQFHFHSRAFQPPPPPPISSSSLSSVSSSSMAALNSELELQNQEIDLLLHFQKEKLRKAIEEQRKEEMKALLSKVEREGWRVMREKEENLADAIRRGRKLEERLKKTETEKEKWQRMANSQESIVMRLRRKLEEANERQIMGKNSDNGGEDAESHYPEAEEKTEEGGENGGSGSLSCCKSCRNRNPCVLFLPCRHLCSCKYCEAFLERCPVCRSVKKATLEVLFS
ncbi:probable BOI-related E3 ubiquitin-protein ligase 2 [Cucurbita maxima]|uniref:Probable BOI-related E3 ubiquitin-protein ligase 2 n=1 Tax=Cucurbita maxima TaxID=3661 RepID=A0A6J1K7X1_CUCMA|nr:probable BOI-related E3 ubiquitin-protein ligase 2 [Cucurbita maxima]